MGAGSDMKLMKSLNEELGVAEEEDGTEDGADLRLDSILRLPVSSTEGTSQRKPSSRSLSTGKARKESSLGGSSSTTRVDKFAGVAKDTFGEGNDVPLGTISPQVAESLMVSVDPSTSLLLIPSDRTVTVSGQCNFRLLRGTLRITGSDVTASKSSYSLFSYPWTQFIVPIETVSKTEDTTDGHTQPMPTIQGVPALVLQSLWSRSGAILLVKELRVESKPLLAEAVLCERTIPVVEGFYLVAGPIQRPSRLFSLWPEWKRIETGVKAYGEGARILIVGSRGCGKSTLARCLCNTLVAERSHAMYLEADVGQPDRTPPGMVSLSNVSSVEFGSELSSVLRRNNHGRSASTVRSYFLGVTSAAGNPDMYTASVVQLVETARKQSKGSPLVVNTHGWVKGLGLELLREIAKLVDPTHVIFLEKKLEVSLSTVDSKQKSVNLELGPKVVSFYVTSINVNSSIPERNAKQLREERISIYFAVSDPVYVVPLAALKVHYVDAEVSERHTLMALNGSVVALCASSLDVDCVPCLWSCVGLGLVRAVDRARGVLYVSTPVDEEVLRSHGVDKLVLSRFVQMPVFTMMAYAGGNRRELPYLVGDAIAVMSTAMKGRGGLKRKRIDNVH